MSNRLKAIGRVSQEIAIGALWFPVQSLHLTVGFGMAAIYTGGYLNHLALDSDRDRDIGVRTLAHRWPGDRLITLAAAFIMAISTDPIVISIFRKSIIVGTAPYSTLAPGKNS